MLVISEDDRTNIHSRRGYKAKRASVTNNKQTKRNTNDETKTKVEQRRKNRAVSS